MDVDEPAATQTQASQPILDVAAREKEFDKQCPGRPRNHKTTLPFHTLLDDLFDPLLRNQHKVPGQRARKQIGPDHGPDPGTHAMRRAIVERYISKWRHQVGPDFFPAMRIMIPEKDRDRAMYGVKEKALARYLVKILRIDKNSEDGYGLINWKVPSKAFSGSAGDFSRRCLEVLQRRPSRVDYGDMTIQDVNDQLDKLSAAVKEEYQLPILKECYQNMNAAEMTWLIRIILRQMKIGATEKTILDVFHPDAEALFNVSSSLRRVCWDLYDENIRLETESRGVTLMQCYQPQLAHYDGNDFPKLINFLSKYATDDDKEFWIEEKLDGERIQMHMRKDDTADGEFVFKFFSRKAKDYTYLYGASLNTEASALTQHLTDAFKPGVESIVLDGEMITWDPELDRQAAFGTLKTAALSEMKNKYAEKQRPLYRIFDILLLNGKLLTQYTLRDRRKALERAINPVHRRFELHEHQIASSAEEIDARLRLIIETAAEGLVLKNPRTSYTLAERTRDWLKVKPEYMQGFGESIDCLIIAGYYGSGKRGGTLSSFLCGLRADKKSKKFLSFFKVGGGIAAEDYATIQHHTEGKWMDYDVKKPPSKYITLAGPAHAPREKPDRWIMPEDSLVVEVKAASIGSSDEFATKLTLRFPRFKKFRQDRDWTNSLTVDEFLAVKVRLEEKQEEEEQKEKEKKFQAEPGRNKRGAGAKRKKPLKVIGYGLPDDEIKTDNDALVSAVFYGLTFYVVTESVRPIRKTKVELEALIKRHGGKIVQTNKLPQPKSADSPARGKKAKPNGKQLDDNPWLETDTIRCIADRRNVKVASLEKSDDTLIIRPAWIFDSIAEAKSDFAHGLTEQVLLVEPERHLFFTPEAQKGTFDDNIDQYGDPFSREISVEELGEIFKKMDDNPAYKKHKPARGKQKNITNHVETLITQEAADEDSEMKGWLFKSHTLYFDTSIDPSINPIDLTLARNIASFTNATISASLDDSKITQIIALPDGSDLRSIRKKLAERGSGAKIPRVVTSQWILQSWKEGTVLDDERFVAR